MGEDEAEKAAKELFERLKELIQDPEMGFREDTQIAIIELFEYAFFEKPMEPEIKAKWEKLGRLINGKVQLDSQFPELDVAMMGLEWEGIIQRVVGPEPQYRAQSPKTENKKKDVPLSPYS